MSATIEEIPYSVLHKVTNRIVTEVEGINRVLYDLTPKRIGTIEFDNGISFQTAVLEQDRISFGGVGAGKTRCIDANEGF